MNSEFFKNGVIAMLTAWFANMLCYIVANWIGWWDPYYINPKNNSTIDWKSITYITALITIIASVLFWLFIKYLSHGKFYFFALSILVFFFLAISILGMPGLPVKMLAVMQLMNLMSAVCILYFLNKIDIANF